jgi:hypothetical protein
MATYEELQRDLAEMRAELQQMRVELAAAQVAPAQLEPRLMSRRNLLRAAPVAAVGGAIVAMSATPAAAATGDPVLLGKANDAGAGKTTSVRGGTPSFPGNAPPVTVPISSPASLDVAGGVSVDWVGAYSVVVGGRLGTDYASGLIVAPEDGSTSAAFLPGQVNQVHTVATGDGLEVRCQGAYGIRSAVTDGQQLNEVLGGYAVAAWVESGTGVIARAKAGTGVEANTEDGHAIVAHSRSATTQNDAVTIDYAGRSRALYAESTATDNINGTITGVNAGNGTGVWGEQRGTGAGAGIVGVGGKAGRGGQVSGGAAQLRMVPATASTHPTTGKAGDFFVDASNRLWFCQKPSSGATAATWKQLA